MYFILWSMGIYQNQKKRLIYPKHEMEIDTTHDAKSAWSRDLE